MMSLQIGRDKRCRACGCELTFRQVLQGGVCDRLECRGPYLQEMRRQRDEERRKWRQAKAEEAKHLAGLELDKRFPITVIPHNDQRLTQTPPERIDEFRKTLRKTISELENKSSDLPNPSSQQAPPKYLAEQAASPSLHVVNACSTCRGSCCRKGGTHAFLDASSLRRFWQTQPGLTADELFDRYVGLLPSESIQESCVFHGEEGCQLSREMRGDTCNSFFCEGLHDHPQHLDQLRADESVAVSVDETGQIGRVARITRLGQRTSCYRRPMAETP